MRNYNKHVYRNSDKNGMQTIKVAIKRNSVERDALEQHLSANPLSSPLPMDTEEIFDLIPAFSPSSSNSLSAEKWIEIIEDLKVIYGWDDRLTLAYASLRLEDAAKRWFKENVCDWPEFKVKFVLRFSNHISKSKYFEQLVNRRKEYNESYENYVFDIERTALKCDCSVETTINYIILGLRDSSLRDELIAMNCKSVDALLSRIKKLTAAHKNDDDDLRNRLGRSSTSLREEARDDIVGTRKFCNKCRKPGHYTNECWSDAARARLYEKENPCLVVEEPLKEYESKRKVMCVYCKSFGHYASECHLREIVCHICKCKGHKFYDCKLRGDSHEERKDRRDSEKSFHEERVKVEVFCEMCNSVGHYARDCKSYNFRLKLNNDLHERNERRNSRNSEDFQRDAKLRSLDFCTMCNTERHHRDDCKVVGKGSFNEIAFMECKREGHKSYDCGVNLNGERPHEDRRDERRKEEFRMKCKTEGIARDCNDGSSSFSGNFCPNCRRRGHTLQDCHFIIDQKLREERRKSRNSENFDQNIETKKSNRGDHHEKVHDDREKICQERSDQTKKVFPKFRDDKRRKERSPEDYVLRRSMFSQRSELKTLNTGGCDFIEGNNLHSRKNRSENKDKNVRDNKEETRRTCYICRKTGHYARDCPFDNNLKRHTSDGTSKTSPPKKPRVSEGKMEKITLQNGVPSKNDANECQPITLVPEKINSINKPYASIKLNRSLSEFLKPVRIDNVYVTALINLSSDCTTLQRSEFEKHDWKFEPCNLEVNGFGHSSSMSIGKISKNVGVEEVELMTDILIVEDDLQDFPLVLGSNFLDHPSVCIVKKYRSLEIKLVAPKTQVVPVVPSPLPPPVMANGIEEQQIKIKIEPKPEPEPESEAEAEGDVEEHLDELLSMMKEDCS